MPLPARRRLVEWGMAGRAIPGETASGDNGLVRDVDDGVLVAVVDALGHGQEAAESASFTVAALEQSADESVISLIRQCHQALKGRRGVVMSLASFNRRDSTMTWVGVGNVEGVLLQPDGTGGQQRATLITRGGIVGSELPILRAEVLPVNPGDCLLFATDGIGGTFWDRLDLQLPPQELAESILRDYGKTTDDALALAVKYVGPV